MSKNKKVSWIGILITMKTIKVHIMLLVYIDDIWSENYTSDLILRLIKEFSLKNVGGLEFIYLFILGNKGSKNIKWYVNSTMVCCARQR